MAKEMEGSRIIYLGETHNNLLIHNIQPKVLQALFKEDERCSRIRSSIEISASRKKGGTRRKKGKEFRMKYF